MSSDGSTPKLYVNKPKKSQLKQKQSVPSSSMSSSSSAAAQSYTGGAAPPPPPPPPQPPKESFARRYRFAWPLLLAVNFSVGAYLLMRTKKKDVKEEASEETSSIAAAPVSTTVATATVTVPEKTSTVPPPIIQPPKPREPIPEKEQRELLKWILEEKRKVKPKDSEEKKRIDEEKALLKQFIRAKELPNL